MTNRSLEILLRYFNFTIGQFDDKRGYDDVIKGSMMIQEGTVIMAQLYHKK